MCFNSARCLTSNMSSRRQGQRCAFSSSARSWRNRNVASSSSSSRATAAASPRPLSLCRPASSCPQKCPRKYSRLAALHCCATAQLSASVARFGNSITQCVGFVFRCKPAYNIRRSTSSSKRRSDKSSRTSRARRRVVGATLAVCRCRRLRQQLPARCRRSTSSSRAR